MDEEKYMKQNGEWVSRVRLPDPGETDPSATIVLRYQQLFNSATDFGTVNQKVEEMAIEELNWRMSDRGIFWRTPKGKVWRFIPWSRVVDVETYSPHTF